MKQLCMAMFVVTACSSPSPQGAAIDAAVDTSDSMPDGNRWSEASCDEPFAHIVEDGLVPFGPSYTMFPPRMSPPLAYLSPNECIAVRIEHLAPDGIRVRIDADAVVGWTATAAVDGAPPVDVIPAQVAPNVVEATLDLPDHPTYVTLIASPGYHCICNPNLSLEHFSDGTVAVVGYGGNDCCGGPR